MRRLSAAALALAVLAATPAAAQLQDGVYELQGRTPDGGTYDGVVTMRAGPGGSWLVAWQVGNARVAGLGVLHAGVLAVAFSVSGTPGVAAYDVDGTGRLRGTWTAGTGLGSEILTPRARAPR